MHDGAKVLRCALNADCSDCRLTTLSELQDHTSMTYGVDWLRAPTGCARPPARQAGRVCSGLTNAKTRH